MEDTEKDLRFLSAGIEDLPQYLSSKNLFWPLSQSAIPLTIGNLLFVLRRLLSNSQRNAKLDHFSQMIEMERAGNRALFQKKELAEVDSRTREWGNSVEDWRENGVDLPSLKTDLRNRAILELLLADLESTPIKTSISIERSDEAFKRLTEAGDFVWEIEIKSAFPLENFWFLWQKPLGRNK